MKRYFLILVTAFAACSVWAADLVDEVEPLDNDFRMRFEVAAEWKPVKGLSLTLSQEVRLKNNVTDLDRLYTTLDVSYKVYKYIKVGATYSFHALYAGADASQAWKFRHRGRLHVTGSVDVNNWGLSLRLMPEVTYTATDYNPLETVNPVWLMRTRFKVDYGFVEHPVSPYASIEMFNPLKKVAYSNAWLEKMRYTLGVEWSVNASNKLDFYYLLEHDMGQDISVGSEQVVRSTANTLNHIIGIKYKFVF